MYFIARYIKLGMSNYVLDANKSNIIYKISHDTPARNENNKQ